MRITRSKARVISELTIDADIDFGGHSITSLADLEVNSISTDVDLNSHVLSGVGNIILVKNSGTRLLADLATDGDWCGETVMAKAGEGLTALHAVALVDDGMVWKSDANTIALMPIKGIATNDVLPNANGIFLIEGFYRTDTHGFAIGALLYASLTPGAITDTPPAGTGDLVQRIGIAVTANVIWFRPDLTMVEVA